MNNTRRKEIEAQLLIIEEATQNLREIGGEEQDGFNNLPEGLQMSEKGEKMEENVEGIDRICDEIDGLREEFDEILE